MTIRKLTLAAAISIGMLSVAIPASFAADESQTSQSTCPTAQAERKPTAVGGGVAGTFKAFGTQGSGTPIGGSSEIAQFTSPSNAPVSGAAALASQGIYGNCVPCQQAAQPCPVQSPCPQQPSAPLSQEKSSSMTIQQQVPSTTGGAAEACPATTPTEEGMKAPQTPMEMPSKGSIEPTKSGKRCVTVPTTPPQIETGSACPVMQTCIPGASTGKASATAPKGFELPPNPSEAPNNITPPTTRGLPSPSGMAAPSETYVAPSAPPAQAMPMAPMQESTGGACPTVPQCPQTYVQPSPQPCAPQAVQPAQPVGFACPLSAINQANLPTGLQPGMTIAGFPMPAQQQKMILSQPCQVTGGAAPVSGPSSATCAAIPGKTQYIERQVYSYPSLRNTMNVVPTGEQLMTFGSGVTGQGGVSTITPIAQTADISGASAISSPVAGTITGAASPISTGCPLNSVTVLNGTPITQNYNLAATQPITIQTQSSMTFSRMVMVPSTSFTTGAAAPMTQSFSDVPQGFWASNAINNLVAANVISGYPDRTFKPNLPVSRAEFASMLVSAINLNNQPVINQQLYRDVPPRFWANSAIDRAYNAGLIAGYPNDTYRPNAPVSRAEALTTISKALSQKVSGGQQAEQVLSSYQDASEVPTWARIPVANALQNGILNNTQSPNSINPNRNATRADVASMLSQLRIALGIQQPTVASSGYPTGGAAQIQQEVMTVPTLNVKFNDRITARASHVGDKFKATTLEPVVINNVAYPAGSTVNGSIVEVIQPSSSNTGALKLAFDNITYGNQNSVLPKDIITAQVSEFHKPGILSRVVSWPLIWPGRLVGTAGRTVGAMTVIAGNGVEQTFGSGGIALSDVVQGQGAAAGRAGIGSAVALGRGALEIVQTGLNGVAGIANVSADELAFLVGSSGQQVASVQPNDTVTIAFGCMK